MTRWCSSGSGAIGSFICSALRGHEGPIVAMDIDESRLAVARSLGATETVLIPRDIGPAQIRDLLPAGADTVFETSGVLGSAERAFALAARGGNVVLVGLNKTPQPLNLADIVLREVNVQTTVAHVCGTDLPEALDLLTEARLSATLLDHVVAVGRRGGAGPRPACRGHRGREDPRGPASWLRSPSWAWVGWVRRWRASSPRPVTT